MPTPEVIPEVSKEPADTNTALDNKKMLTKGALKVFEGLKVSIPTDDLDLTEVLGHRITTKAEDALDKGIGENCDTSIKKSETTTSVLEERLNDVKKVETCVTRGPRLFKTVKANRNKLKKAVTTLRHKSLQKGLVKSAANEEDSVAKMKESKNIDVYDFEETQDNSDIFCVKSLTPYSTFRSQMVETGDRMEPPSTIEKSTSRVKTKETDSNADTSNCTDTFSCEGRSVSSISTASNLSLKKTKTEKNITKKKCMIMGRIFKNALKSKMEDDIREIPVVDNTKLVKDYVLNCPAAVDDLKPKMTEDEMNRLFNNLLDDKPLSEMENRVAEDVPKTKTEPLKPPALKQKPQRPAKSRKRHRNNSESTDDEFSIAKPPRKRTNKKCDKEMDNSINLEQELKECIGVASRKSQRKCTSGKQNVLVESWSSDDSVSEAILEMKSIQESVGDKPLEKNVASPKVTTDEEKVIKLQPTDNVSQVANEKPPADEKIVVKATAAAKPQKKQKKLPPKGKTKPKAVGSERPKPIQQAGDTLAASRRKRTSVNTLYYWSSSSEDEFQDMIEMKNIRDEFDDEDRPMQHGWIVGDSPKKLVMMLAQAKGKKLEVDCVKEQAKNRTAVSCS